MIARLWHGWTTVENATAYERLLKTEIFPAIAARDIAGYRGIHLLRHDGADEVEFITVMWFADWAAVKAFAGEDYAHGVVPPAAQALLKRFDAHSQHFDVLAAP